VALILIPRTSIEEEYAQKLAKLAKIPIAVEEVGYVSCWILELC
jgi:hypothetical protein